MGPLTQRILVVGGYGAFGARIVERLALQDDRDIIVAGRSEAKATQFVANLPISRSSRLSSVGFDARDATALRLRELGAGVIVNASGPFQEQDYTLARAAIGAGAHYVDIADARGFVCGIGELNAAAHAAGVTVVSGASSVPGLSSSVVAAHADAFHTLDHIDIAISPGNRFDPGLATTASVLRGVGAPIRMMVQADERTVHGWQGLRRVEFPGLGPRFLGYVDVPDLTLLAQRYPGVGTIRFQAGVEVGLFHLGLWGLSWLARAGLVRRPEVLARPLLAAKRALGFLGSDRGGMRLVLGGRDESGRTRVITWSLVAGSGHGPYVPALGAVVLVTKLLNGEFAGGGALPCVGLFTLDEFAEAARGLDISFDLSQSPPPL